MGAGRLYSRLYNAHGLRTHDVAPRFSYIPLSNELALEVESGSLKEEWVILRIRVG